MNKFKLCFHVFYISFILLQEKVKYELSSILKIRLLVLKKKKKERKKKLFFRKIKNNLI